LLVAAVSCSLILGSILFATIHLRTTYEGTDRFSKSQADQMRLIDYIARDLRNAVSVGVNSVDNPMMSTSNRVLTISPSDSLVLRVPRYYKASDPNDAEYDVEFGLYSYGTGVAYGDNSGPAGYSTIVYSKEVTTSGNVTFHKFVRTEDGVREEIVSDPKDQIDLDITVVTSGIPAGTVDRVFIVEAWFAGQLKWMGGYGSNVARVTSSDRILLRNPRIDF
jgi:hypothetical protein